MSSADLVQRSGFGSAFVGDERHDVGDESLHRCVGAALDLLLGQQREEAFDLIDRGRRRRREVHVPVRSLGEPARITRVLWLDALSMTTWIRGRPARCARPRRGRRGTPARDGAACMCRSRRRPSPRLGRHRRDEAGEQRRRAVSVVVVRAPSTCPMRIGSTGCVDQGLVFGSFHRRI